MAGDPRARRRRLLVLGAGPAQLGLLEAARAAGIDTVVVDRNPSAPGFALATRRAVVSTEDEPAVERLARAEEVDGLISPGADWPVGVAARVAARMALPHPIDVVTAALATNKARQRARLAEAGVPQPRAETLSALRSGLPVPCVVKAPDRQGQRGLTLVRSPGELPAAVAAALEASRSGTCLVEELVEGPEVTVNALSLGGAFAALTVTDRLTAEPPAFGVALAHVFPSEHDVGAAVEAARAAAEALGVRDGPTYTQLRLGPDGPRVVELAARLGGGHDAELVHAATGYDLNAAALALALGEAPEEPSGSVPLSPSPAAVVRFLVAPPGRLAAVAGVEAAAELPGVDWVRVYRRPGDLVAPLRRGADRAGAVLAVGATRGEALARADRAADAVRFHVDAAADAD